MIKMKKVMTFHPQNDVMIQSTRVEEGEKKRKERKEIPLNSSTCSENPPDSSHRHTSVSVHSCAAATASGSSSKGVGLWHQKLGAEEVRAKRQGKGIDVEKELKSLRWSSIALTFGGSSSNVIKEGERKGVRAGAGVEERAGAGEGAGGEGAGGEGTGEGGGEGEGD